MVVLGLFKLLGGEGVSKSKEAKKEGFKIGFSFDYGSIFQLGFHFFLFFFSLNILSNKRGVMLIKKGQEIIFRYNCKTTYDFPKIEDLPFKDL